jgi:hypothetical protein
MFGLFGYRKRYFKVTGQSGQSRVIAKYTDGRPAPVKIDEHAVDYSDWPESPAPIRRSRRLQNAPVYPSAEALLRVSPDSKVQCYICGQGKGLWKDGWNADKCRTHCYKKFLADDAEFGNNNTEIREMTKDYYGVFVPENGSTIPAGTCLGEYLGKLFPRSYDTNSSYVWNLTHPDLPEPGPDIDAETFANWTRFMNHHCKNNVTGSMRMVGRRWCVIFTTDVDIKPGTELTIHYGSSYFTEHFKCLCDDKKMPHIPR